jgi:hypothetical protein
MSTCPRCKGHLSDDHKCPRRPVVVGVELALAALAGGVAALLLVAAVDPHGRLSSIDSAVVVIGALAAIGLTRLLRH